MGDKTLTRMDLSEAVFREVVAEQGLEDRVEIDSAGTGSWHIGEEPDARTQQAALHRGIDMSAQRARQVTRTDFHEFDYLLHLCFLHLFPYLQNLLHLLVEKSSKNQSYP